MDKLELTTWYESLKADIIHMDEELDVTDDKDRINYLKTEIKRCSEMLREISQSLEEI